MGVLEASAEHAFGQGGGWDDLGDEAMDSTEQAYETTDGTAGSAHAHARPRVRVVEGWYRRTVRAEIMRGGDFHGEIFDPWSRGHIADVSAARASVLVAPKRLVFVALMTPKGLLYHGPSPYRHNRFPLIPVWGHRRAHDGMPYGMVRNLRSIQRDLNKRRSKALDLLVSSKLVAAKGQFGSRNADVEATREEAGRPDGVILYDATKGPAPQLVREVNLAQAHIALMDQSQRMIESVSGVTNELMGRETNASSGIAIQRRQAEGALSTSHYLESLRLARMQQGALSLSLIEQFYTDEKQFRLTDARGNPRYVHVNADAEGLDDITTTKADFVIAERDWNATSKQADAAILTELVMQVAQTAPELGVQLLDLAVEVLDVPNRDEIVKRIRQITGVTDPDADPDNPDPETQALQQAKAAQAAMAERGMQAEIAHKEAQAAKSMAEAGRIAAQARAEQRAITTTEIENIREATATALDLAGRPEIGRVVDLILAQAQERAAAEPGAGPSEGPMNGPGAIAGPEGPTSPDALPPPEPQAAPMPDPMSAPLPAGPSRPAAPDTAPGPVPLPTNP